MKGYFYLAAIVAASVLASCSSHRAYTEERVVYTRPAPVEYARPSAPSSNLVWVDGEYIWRNGRYEYVKGYWIQPQGNRHYVKGYWTKRGRGYTWVPGHWR